MKDFGYDITDYKAVYLLFGNEADIEELIEKAHNKEIKLILDIVPNHTSDMHPWFLKAKASKNSAKRNWYIWKDARETAANLITGWPCLGVAHGNGMPLRNNIITTPS